MSDTMEWVRDMIERHSSLESQVFSVYGKVAIALATMDRALEEDFDGREALALAVGVAQRYGIEETYLEKERERQVQRYVAWTMGSMLHRYHRL